ncbi:hypothetical protein MRB53_008381 [Persea americana]|uniref:Uncharacterized protein n=1 Tax=Persea americana TaxID=3435 RepID=A0ACC2MMN9_PERAE|nr:hypothetical protein MRB53_008381 [Persea americana]
MTDALVSFVVEELGAIVKDEVGLLASVKKELKSLSSTFSAIQALLADAERKQVTTEGVRDWLGKIKEVAYEVEDILDERRIDAFMSQHDEDDIGKIQKVRSCSLFPCLCFKQVTLRHDIGHRIREVRERLNEISDEKSKFNLEGVEEREIMSGERETGSFIDESNTFGRDEVKERIIDQLVSETSREEKSVSIVSIVGMGGLGKTTLARLLYNDERVMAQFENRIWVCVSEPFDVKRIAIKVIESMGRSTSNNPDLDTLQHGLREAIDKKRNPDLDTLQHGLREAIDKKRILLVLDDVWNEDYALWEKLKNPLMGAAQGSKVVVTARIHQVAVAMETPPINVHELGILSYSVCWKLFHSRALEGTEQENCRELTEMGEKIVKRCKGVPLAVKAVGSLLRGTRAKQDWEHIFDSKIWDWAIANDDTHKNGILPSLLLSYYNLPYHLKRCFSFCSVFPKDYAIEKDKLVKLWMAHGIIKSEEAKKDVTETFGERCFDYLLTRSLFQDAEKDEYGNIVRCKMHDLVHDLATFVSSDDHRSMEAGHPELSSIKCHHLSLLVRNGMSSIPSPLCGAERLRTLLLFGFPTIKEVPESLFNHLKFLRALDLGGTYIENLPSFVGKLKHLRYLSLYRSNIKELPEFVTNLCNLQTLKLNACASLCILPSGMSKMVKLRHLEIEETDNLKDLPNGLGRLSALRTLCKFPVGDENKGCKIEELKELNLLRGKLSINNLERVMNEDDARKAELHNKKDLHVLSFCCNNKSNEEWKTLGDDEMKRMDSVLEGLRPPHSNLKELKIENYAGSKLPSWLEDSGFSSLVIVVLEECKRLSSLPEGLGQLKTLQTLHIDGCERLSSLPEGLGQLKALQTLYIRNCEQLSFLPEEVGQLKALQTLHIWNCERLSSLPEGLGQLKALQTLHIRNCERLSSLPEGLGQLKALQTLHIGYCERLSSMPEGLGKPKALQTLHIGNYERLSSLPEGLGQLKALQTLHIGSYERLSSLPEGLGQLKALQTLNIWNCERLSSLPEGLGQLKALETLDIGNCERLSSLPEGLGQLKALQTLHIRNCKGLSSLPEGLGQLKALERLYIWNCKGLSSLPEGLGQLKALQALQIKNCKRLSSLPEELGQLKTLQTLHIENCERLSSLPEGLGQLKALQTLHIGNCERLSSLPEGLGQLKALQTLDIGNFERLSSLPEGLGQLKALQTLYIWNFERLSSLPEGLGQLKALQTLEIDGCKQLSSLSEELGQLKALQTLHIENCGQLSSLPEGLGQLKALETLHIWNCERLSSLPEGLRQLKALETLYIENCERLSSLFDGFEQLKSLCRLEIWDCPQLRPLPNLQRLTTIKTLSIHRCPLVTERLEKEKGEDWCKISHIPYIEIDNERIQEAS